MQILKFAPNDVKDVLKVFGFNALSRYHQLQCYQYGLFYNLLTLRISYYRRQLYIPILNNFPSRASTLIEVVETVLRLKGR